MFYKKVDLRVRKSMVEFLQNHFRYSTMNSWNLSTSYAHNLKIHTVIPQELRNNAYELIEQGDIYEEINMLIEEFNADHNYIFQAGFNGRSGGYLVLYRGNAEKKIIFKEEAWKNNNRNNNGMVFEDGYGWKNLKEAKKEGLLNKERLNIQSFPGQDIDQEVEFNKEEWDLNSLQERVKLIE